MHGGRPGWSRATQRRHGSRKLFEISILGREKGKSVKFYAASASNPSYPNSVPRNHPTRTASALYE